MENSLINININKSENPIDILFQIEDEEPIIILQSSHPATITFTEGQKVELKTKDGRRFKLYAVKGDNLKEFKD